MTPFARFTRATRAAATSFRRSFYPSQGASGYDVAGASGRWPGRYILHAPTSQALAARTVAARRIAWLAENSALVSSIIGNAVTAIVADGPTVRPNHPDPATNQDLQDRWSLFCEDCTVEGGHSLGGVLALIARSLLIDGEAFVQFVVDPITMQVRLRRLTAEQVDASVTRPSVDGTSAEDVAGVRYSNGRVIGYWILPTPPDAPSASVRPANLIDALDIAHVFEPHTPGQPRGISALTSVAPLAMELDVAHDAVVMKLKTTALVGMIVRDMENNVFDFNEAATPPTLELYPGATLRLPPGTDVSFPPVSDMSSTSEVLRHMSRLICAGAGVPYFLAANDFGEINYSAGKLGLAAFQRRVKAIQENHLVAQFLSPLWKRFVLLEILSGRLRAPDYEARPLDYGATFLWRGWPPLDELKAAKADVLELNAMLRSRAEIAAARGIDIADLDREISNDALAPDLSASAGNVLSQTDVESNNA